MKNKHLVDTVSKPFDDMSPSEKLEHIKKCVKEAKEETLKITYLADILDVFDFWIPYLINQVEQKLDKEDIKK